MTSTLSSSIGSEPVAANHQLLGRILALYHLKAISEQSPQKGYRNTAHPIHLSGGAMVNLIMYKGEPGVLQKIQNANVVSDYLATVGFPTRQTYQHRIVRLQSGSRQKYAALYNYLPGRTIPWESYTKHHLKLLGKTMSDMHAALQAGPAVKPRVTDEYQAIAERMTRYFDNPGVREAMTRKLNCQVLSHMPAQFAHLMHYCARFSGQQTLHMDLVRGNILFEGEGEKLRISGILDFEKTTTGPRLFDIARTLAFLLVDCKYTPEDKVRKYFLYSGYQKRGKLPMPTIMSGQLNVLEVLINLFLLYDFYKFLRHNPYEYLAQNEHFVRTRDLLVRRNVIKMIE